MRENTKGNDQETKKDDKKLKILKGYRNSDEEE